MTLTANTLSATLAREAARYDVHDQAVRAVTVAVAQVTVVGLTHDVEPLYITKPDTALHNTKCLSNEFFLTPLLHSGQRLQHGTECTTAFLL
jgi:hypothetical protein